MCCEGLGEEVYRGVAWRIGNGASAPARIFWRLEACLEAGSGPHTPQPRQDAYTGPWSALRKPGLCEETLAGEQVRELVFLFPQPGGSPAEPTLPGDRGLKKLVQERVAIHFLSFRGSLGKCASAPWQERPVEAGKKFWEKWECRDLQEGDGESGGCWECLGSKCYAWRPP